MNSAWPKIPSADELFECDFATHEQFVRAYAHERGQHIAVCDESEVYSYSELNAVMDSIAAALQRDGIGKGDVVATCATNSAKAAALFLGILRAGAVVAPLPPAGAADALAGMLRDAGAQIVFSSDDAAGIGAAAQSSGVRNIQVEFLDQWYQGAGNPTPVKVKPSDAFNIIYSSGTTGVPKGIVQPYSMRWAQIRRGVYAPDSVTLLSTPLYSNTTLVSFLPTIANGGTAILMRKFDAGRFLRLAELHRVTHAMLVPVQYQRILSHPEFDQFDLSSFQTKFATSAPFSAELKAEVLRRWPGGLVEFYGMTEGGGSCMLLAHEHPDKLHTVGQPMAGHDIRLIDDDGIEVKKGEQGEVVGRSAVMMREYHNLPAQTDAASWRSPEGLRFIRTGDIGRYDEDGFLVLVDRKKDMIISGGFNIYPSDIEVELLRNEHVAEAAVVGVPSDRWGETPVAFVVPKPGAQADQILDWVNERLGKTQRLADLRLIDELPRSPIGKVLKRELREFYGSAVHERG